MSGRRRLIESPGGFSLVLGSDDRREGTTTHDFTINFSPNIDFSTADRWQVALEQLSLWHTLFNISNDFGNTVFRYRNATVYKTIDITPGIYAAQDLIDYLETRVLANGDDPEMLQWAANTNTQKFILTLGGGYRVDFTDLPIRTVFGAANIEYTSSTSMPNVAQMSNGVNQWILHCDLVDYGYMGKYPGKPITSFSPDVAPGAAILINPQLVYVLIREAKSISSIRFWLTDQTGRPLNINNEPVDIKLHFIPLNYV